MSQIQWTLIFMISIFESGISSATLETTNTTVLRHSNGSMTNKTVATTENYEKEKMTSSIKNSSELPEHLQNGTTFLKDEKENRNLTNCHLTDEAKDMLDCIVSLDDAAIQPTANSSQKILTATNRIKQEISMFNDTYPSKIFPQDKNVKSIDEADEAIRKRLNHTLYTISEETADTSSIIGTNKKSNRKNMNSTSLTNNKNDIQSTDLENNLEIAAQKSEDKEGMSWGMIILTMMLTFVVTITIIYASIIVWKRYLEYKCNNRQLLDNDSEFDANDLHHFEL